jgi:Domain of unknown function (DUF1906)
MRRLCVALLSILLFSCAAFLFLGAGFYPSLPLANAQPKVVYLGFDRNEYPGDEALPILRKTFAFTSYWIGPPPGEKQSSWIGKRAPLQDQGFGLVVLFNAREGSTVKNVAEARQKGASDAEVAAKSAEREGFSKGAVIFLDVEEGGRLSPSYHQYLQSWFEGLTRTGYRPGVYCSAIPVNEGHGVSITTAKDIQDHAGPREIIFWVYNDACPPSPGCSFSPNTPSPSQSGFVPASIWQYVRSPREKEFTRQCPANYAVDGNCYAPGDSAHQWFLDVNTASSPDPSSTK